MKEAILKIAHISAFHQCTFCRLDSSLRCVMVTLAFSWEGRLAMALQSNGLEPLPPSFTTSPCLSLCRVSLPIFIEWYAGIHLTRLLVETGDVHKFPQSIAEDIFAFLSLLSRLPFLGTPDVVFEWEVLSWAHIFECWFVAGGLFRKD